MKFLRKLALPVIIVFSFFLISRFGYPSVFAQSTDNLTRLEKEIEEYEAKLSVLKKQSLTLSNQIAQYNAQINLTQLKISETKEKIQLLGGRIDQLETSLDALSNAFSGRARETYKMSRLNQPLAFLLSADNLDIALVRYHYLKKIQEADRTLLLRLQSAQTSYKDEKSDQEKLQEQLEVQRKNLDAQKKAKAYLLQATKNDEKKYQQLLAQAKAEYEAIQAITAGKGVETKVGKVDEGEKIASIIQGTSCNSSGTHLHFMVRSGTTALNPFNYLNPNISYENCSGSSCGSGDGDSFNPSGSWNWPINSPIKFSQGFGTTWAVRNSWVGRIYSFHNGIDINSESSSTIKAVKSGILYRGSYSGGGGCRLRYVRVDHDGSDLDTLYLHVNY